MDRCVIDCPGEHLLECKDPMLGVQKQAGKNLALFATELTADNRLGAF
jgi:hypothetical protein